MKVSTKNSSSAKMPFSPLILEGRVHAENASLLKVGADCAHLPEAQIDDDRTFLRAVLAQALVFAVVRQFVSYLLAVASLFKLLLVLATRSRVAV
ncbi:hypothetical protein [Chelativorans sp. AA-79]|uniref:hypothetical protein n=1 Tax=Chelativorans sp. AA-79 TaxID=3028735 RepID=UPI0023F696B2|nr:hypothetical protein [Chelativorans sp. AA-79]WEX09224.1 hypothetical protein PVE73_24865 [Chelativorans sp. AA-79]